MYSGSLVSDERGDDLISDEDDQKRQRSQQGLQDHMSIVIHTVIHLLSPISGSYSTS